MGTLTRFPSTRSIGAREGDPILRLGDAFTVAVASGIVAGALAVSAGPAAAEPAWSITPTPNPVGASKTTWNGVSCPSTSSCFAVGRANGKSIAARRQAGVWNIVFSPAIVQSVLNDIACPTTTSCFAVGSRRGGPNFTEVLVEHWNGRTWTKMRVPDLFVDAELFGVSCPSRTNCFAVGRRGYPTRTLVERWNGKKWLVVPSKNPSSDSALSAVSCPSTNRCYAVGSKDGRYGRGALIQRWDGGAWSVMKGAPVENAYLNMTGVSCPSLGRCVAVGSMNGPGAPQSPVPIVQHWNGSRWSNVSNPTPPGERPAWSFSDVTCPSTNSCFAVGWSGRADLYSPVDVKTLVEHWDGTSWSITESSTPDASGDAWLSDVSCPSTSNCHAVGAFQINAQGGTTTRSLAEVYDELRYRWAVEDSNLRPHPCEGCALAV